MKRISYLLVLVFAVLPAVRAAGYYGVPPRFRTHYSPYAFGHGKSGLVYGGVRYSPYAFATSGSGLVFHNVGYSPYAFGHGRSGLIAQYCGAYAPCHFGPTPEIREGSETLAWRRVTCERARPSGPGRQQPPPEVASAAPPAPTLAEKDAVEIIRHYLYRRGVSRFQVTKPLRIDNETLSADFVLPCGTIIKFWNHEQIQLLPSKAAHKNEAYQRYWIQWEQYAKSLRDQGKKIYTVIASQEDEIVAMLDLCKEIAAG